MERADDGRAGVGDEATVAAADGEGAGAPKEMAQGSAGIGLMGHGRVGSP